MDFAHHVLEHLEVSNNDYDGLGVMYSDIYFPDRVNTIKNSKFNANKRHGISFRQVCTLTQLQPATFFLTSYTFIANKLLGKSIIPKRKLFPSVPSPRQALCLFKHSQNSRKSQN